VLWYLETQLVDAGTAVLLGAAEAYERAFAQPLPTLPKLVPGSRLSARVSGDPDALRASLEADRERVPAVFERDGQRDSGEPIRLKLSCIHARLGATQEAVAALDAGHIPELRAVYPSATHFAADLQVVAAALVQATGSEPLDREGRVRELLGRRPLAGPHVPLDDASARCLEVFHTIGVLHEEAGPEVAETYIISMARTAEDLLRVCLLGREAGLLDLAASPARSAIDIVPLFETRDDLLNAPQVLHNPYVDVLSLLQVSFLRRKRAGEEVDDALGTTLDGIAQGLRNTG